MFSDNEITIEQTTLLLSLSIQTETRAYLFCQLHSFTHRSFRVHSTLFISKDHLPKLIISQRSNLDGNNFEYKSFVDMSSRNPI